MSRRLIASGLVKGMEPTGAVAKASLHVIIGTLFLIVCGIHQYLGHLTKKHLAEGRLKTLQLSLHFLV